MEATTKDLYQCGKASSTTWNRNRDNTEEERLLEITLTCDKKNERNYTLSVCVCMCESLW